MAKGSFILGFRQVASGSGTCEALDAFLKALRLTTPGCLRLGTVSRPGHHCDQPRHTGNNGSLVATLATSDEDDISLTRIRIFLLQEEKLVDSVFSQGRDLDDGSDWPSEALFKDKVFLPSDLRGRARQSIHFLRTIRAGGGGRSKQRLTPSSRWSRSFRAFSFTWSVVKPIRGAMSSSP
jgi:hypothetical protein